MLSIQGPPAENRDLAKAIEGAGKKQAEKIKADAKQQTGGSTATAEQPLPERNFGAICSWAAWD